MTGIAYGSLENPKLTFTGPVKLWAGINKISLLSSSVGLAVSSQTFCLVIFVLDDCTSAGIDNF